MKNTGPFEFERFGKLFKALRLKRNLTMETLAKLAKTSKGYISGIEHGKVGTPAPDMAAAMVKVLGANPTAFIALCDLEKLLPLVKGIPSIRSCINAQYEYLEDTSLNFAPDKPALKE